MLAPDIPPSTASWLDASGSPKEDDPPPDMLSEGHWSLTLSHDASAIPLHLKETFIISYHHEKGE